jgi:hypothetical protein
MIAIGLGRRRREDLRRGEVEPRAVAIGINRGRRIMGGVLTLVWSGQCDRTQPRDNQESGDCPAHRRTVSPRSRKNKRATLSKLMFSALVTANVATCVNDLESACEPY